MKKDRTNTTSAIKNDVNKTVVIYESKYGSTRRYARWIAEALGCPLFEKKNCRPQDLEQYDTIIYGGGLYAGGVSGIRLLIKNWPALRQKNVILFTCGLSDPQNPADTAHIRQALDKVLSPEMMKKLQIFHLRGGIDYSKLNPIHRCMMSMLRKMLLKKDAALLTEEDRYLLDTYGKQVDFTDQASIRPLIDYVHSLQSVS